MPVENPCVRISQLEEEDDDDVSVGEATIDMDFRGMAEGNSRDPIWGGQDSTWTIYANEETEIGFFLHLNVKEKNYHLASASVKVGDLLRSDEEYPNVWLDFSGSSIFSKGQIQVRLNQSGVPSLHPQQTCPHITPGPAIVSQSSYVIRKMALYSCTPVMLNVYDVSNNVKIENLNKYIKATMGAGIFHAAIEVHGKEYSFGGTLRKNNSTITGVFACAPKKCPMHHYRESVYLGDCELSPAHVERILEELRPKWMASSYNLFRKNCSFFSREVAIQLGVGDIPEWVYILAESAGFIEPYLVKLNNHLSHHTNNNNNNNNNNTKKQTTTAVGVQATTPKNAAMVLPPKTKNKVAAKPLAPAKHPKPASNKNKVVTTTTTTTNTVTAITKAPRAHGDKVAPVPPRAPATTTPKQQHKPSKSDDETKDTSSLSSSSLSSSKRSSPQKVRCNSADRVVGDDYNSNSNSEEGQTVEVMLDHAMAARIQRSFRFYSSVKRSRSRSRSRSQRVIRQVLSEEC
jgi:hypothetical protein